MWFKSRISNWTLITASSNFVSDKKDITVVTSRCIGYFWKFIPIAIQVEKIMYEIPGINFFEIDLVFYVLFQTYLIR